MNCNNTRKQEREVRQTNKKAKKDKQKKKDEIMARRHETIGKAQGERVMNKGTDREKEKGHGCNEEKGIGGRAKQEWEFHVTQV
jgi:hypothetical protein